MRTSAAIIGIALALTASFALAHGEAKHGKREPRPISSEETPFGREGDPRKATRTVRVGMADAMRFDPAELTINRGETVQFVVRNRGKLLHEMVIGSMQELKAHAKLMKKHPGMEHDAPYMAHVDPGKEQSITWQFTKAGEFYYGCLIPGHFESGMVGRIIVK